jgi:hypothetical protein
MIQWKKNLYISWVTQILSLTAFGFMMPFIRLYIQQLRHFTVSLFHIGILRPPDE